ncbi:hypothetical protein ACFW2Y_10495 [Streptomyces sp. NPDC058877]|uniref:AMIN-like domain-containing (lipo)protein n=1 Tax=unclassified Streptomyces TaxID=2593676 RepID=UPI0036B2FDCE
MHHRHVLAVAVTGVLLIAGTGATAPAGAAGTPVARGSPSVTALVVNARWGGHAAFDRLVIDVRGAMPPVTVRPTRTLRYDGSGIDVPLAGRHFLEVVLSPAAAHDDTGRPVYRGPRLLSVSLPALKGVALTGDFEGVVTIAAAFDTAPVYKTFRLHSPERFVVDIAHPASCQD